MIANNNLELKGQDQTLLEKSQITRKTKSLRRIKENTNQTVHLNDNNLSNTKQFEPVPQNKEKLYHVCGS